MAGRRTSTFSITSTSFSSSVDRLNARQVLELELLECRQVSALSANKNASSIPRVLLPRSDEVIVDIFSEWDRSLIPVVEDLVHAQVCNSVEMARAIMDRERIAAV